MSTTAGPGSDIAAVPGHSSRATWFEAGAVATAGTVVATIFCCLPFATGIVGAGLAALGARFDPFRPYLSAVSVGFLAYAFYETYRPGARRCGPDGCMPARRSRSRQIVLWSVAIVVACFLTASWWANWIIYWTL